MNGRLTSGLGLFSEAALHLLEPRTPAPLMRPRPDEDDARATGECDFAAGSSDFPITRNHRRPPAVCHFECRDFRGWRFLANRRPGPATTRSAASVALPDRRPVSSRQAEQARPQGLPGEVAGLRPADSGRCERCRSGGDPDND